MYRWCTAPSPLEHRKINKNRGQKNVITKGRQELRRKINRRLVTSSMEIGCMGKSNYMLSYKLKLKKSQRRGQYLLTGQL